ncbi:glycosyltransferase family 4 protein [Stappia stellulata]|uniref:glycosyltransferase family 4 protein n=1 Tax=Stappia stellulata TaxID=71235 RepID=UPI000A035736|nr:glycosyltransferase family 4 protein [Stappia stellulata]
MKIAIVLPKGMHFGPERATAIDLCVHDSVRHSAFRSSTRVFGVAVNQPFQDVFFTGISPDARSPIKAFIKALSDWRPDLIVVHQHIPSAYSIAKNFKNTPVVLYKHNSMRLPLSKIKLFWRRRQIDRFAHCIFVSRFCQEACLSDFGIDPSRTSTIYNGLDVGDWNPSSNREKTVLFAGRASPVKGGLEAASAVAHALRDVSDWRSEFLLSTLDNNQEYLQAVRRALSPLGERARVQTDVPFAAVKAQMETASIVLVPSIFAEPFGRTAIEAMAGGAALVASFRGGLAEVCGDAALKICPEDLATFSGAISDLVRNPVMRIELSERARKRVEYDFSIQKTASSLDSLYGRIAGATV